MEVGGFTGCNNDEHMIYLHQWIYYNKLQWKGGLACDKPSSRVSTYFSLLLPSLRLSPPLTARLSLKYNIIRSSFRESALLHDLCLRLLLFQHADNDHITTLCSRGSFKVQDKLRNSFLYNFKYIM